LNGRNVRDGCQGFTLLELVAALSITAVIGVFAAGFLHPQVKLYYGFDKLAKAEGMCGQAYTKLEGLLRYGYMYHVEPGYPETLAYYVREPGTPNPSCDVDGITYEKLPPVSGWTHISADDLDVDTFDGMTLELDFDGTQARKAKVLIRIMKDEETVYEQEAVIHSMYEYQVEEGETAWAAIGAAVLENAVSRAAA